NSSAATTPITHRDQKTQSIRCNNSIHPLQQLLQLLSKSQSIRCNNSYNCYQNLNPSAATTPTTAIKISIHLLQQLLRPLSKTQFICYNNSNYQRPRIVRYNNANCRTSPTNSNYPLQQYQFEKAIAYDPTILHVNNSTSSCVIIL